MFISVSMPTGDPCLVPVSKITFIETVGSHHARRSDYNNLSIRIEAEKQVVSLICVNDGANDYTIASTDSVSDIEAKLRVRTSR